MTRSAKPLYSHSLCPRTTRRFVLSAQRRSGFVIASQTPELILGKFKVNVMHERELFIAAYDIDNESMRRAYLDSACAGDAALRARVDRLLSREAAAGNFLEQPAADLCADADEALQTEACLRQPTGGEPTTSGEQATIIGKVGDTARTIVANSVNSAPAAASNSDGSTNSPSQQDEAAVALGTLFGRYRVQRVLGSGGMGIVYLAEDLRLGRRVALKIPKFEADADGSFHLVERFRREARTMASVLHRNLCPIFDVDEQDGTHYLTMAFIDGETLAQEIKRGKSCSTRQTADLIRKLALALEAAHRAGVVHRDLKPANVMIDRDGEPILMDFGLAWMVHETDSRVTQSGAIVGTPAYMSPEQAEGDTDNVGAASDIYSLGAMLYELLARRSIHTGSVTRVLFKLMHERPIPPSAVRDDVDPKLEEICWKAISRRPEDRFTSAAKFAEALANFSDGLSSDTSAENGVGRKLNLTSCQIVISNRTDVLSYGDDADVSTVTYSNPPVAPPQWSRFVLASLLLIGALGAAWVIVAGWTKLTDRSKGRAGQAVLA